MADSSTETRSNLIRHIYAVIDGEICLRDGCGQLWRLADDHGLIWMTDVEWFVQKDSDFDDLCGND